MMTNYFDKIVSNYLLKEERGLRILFETLSVGLLLALLVTVILYYKDNKRHKIEIESLKNDITQLTKDNNQYTLEASIGYWLINKPDPINDSILYQFLVSNNAYYPDILLKQAKIESANYTSNIYLTNNNLYGMKTVYTRQTTQIGTINGYGKYTNWCMSTLDRILWDYFTFSEKPSREEYLKVLSKYAEDKSYLSKIQ